MTFDVPARFAVFSDIHGNLPALNHFLQHADATGYDALFCLGDIVGYGAHPNECCDAIRRRNIPSVLGNHDEMALKPDEADNFNDIARRAIHWTHDQLRPENAAFLASLPYRIEAEDCLFVHASPLDSEKWHYILTHTDAEFNFRAFDQRICFVGHSHQPFAVAYADGAIHNIPGDEIPLRDGCRYLINVGSIGQPRDRNPDSCFVEVDRDQSILRFRRLAYPVQEASEAIEKAGLPAELARRITLGL